ncbi:MAG: MFS transporter [Candidatus Azambacteria bacterium]|nr:MFS transporter [Candidatus Azambacteria bacterium]
MWLKKTFIPINRVVKILILSDFIIVSGFGFIAPIFALFLTDKIQGATMETIGFASAIYWLAAVLTCLPIAKHIDKTKTEKDDFYFMIFGSILISIVPFLYIISAEIWHIYAIQVIYGLGYSLRLPGWFGMFTRHIDKNHEGYEWSFDSLIAGVGSGITAALGGIVATRFGFSALFVVIGALSVIGTISLVFLYSIVELDHGGEKKSL